MDLGAGGLVLGAWGLDWNLAFGLGAWGSGVRVMHYGKYDGFLCVRSCFAICCVLCGMCYASCYVRNVLVVCVCVCLCLIVVLTSIWKLGPGGLGYINIFFVC